MKWNLLLTGDNSGKFNMDLDYNLAKNCNDEVFLRFYFWNPYCISLGANQSEDDIDIQALGKSNYELVKRPTGGRAILHAEEVTYSIVMPLSFGLTAKEIYNKVSLSLIEGLKIYDNKLSAVELESEQPNFPKLLNEPTGSLCFASTAKYEVKFKGKKLIGSAQRKLDKVILQHGSILCGTIHRELPQYLNIGSDQKDFLLNEMIERTIEIETILNYKTDYSKLIDSLIMGFENIWNIELEENRE